jgi:hypothetical protein
MTQKKTQIVSDYTYTDASTQLGTAANHAHSKLEKIRRFQIRSATGLRMGEPLRT